MKKYISKWLLFIGKRRFKDASSEEIAALCYLLTIRFCMPLKAVMFRLLEEEYIDDISVYMSNYTFIKQSISESSTKFTKRVKRTDGE